MHYSPDGAIQYKGNAFGAPRRHLMVVRYSGGKDVEILNLDSSGKVVGAQAGNAGLSGFVNPIDLIEDNATGNLYVADYGAQTITLLRPIGPGARPGQHHATSTTRLPPAPPARCRTSPSPTPAPSPLAFPADGLVINGPDATQFLLAGTPPCPRRSPRRVNHGRHLLYPAGRHVAGRPHRRRAVQDQRPQ